MSRLIVAMHVEDSHEKLDTLARYRKHCPGSQDPRKPLSLLYRVPASDLPSCLDRRVGLPVLYVSARYNRIRYKYTHLGRQALVSVISNRA